MKTLKFQKFENYVEDFWIFSSTDDFFFAKLKYTKQKNS